MLLSDNGDNNLSLKKGSTRLMAVTYKKLWHILIDRNLKKKDLEEMAGITHYQMCKLSKDKAVTTDVLGAVCSALDVRVEEIMDFIPRK